MKKNHKRLLAVILTICMVTSLVIPASAEWPGALGDLLGQYITGSQSATQNNSKLPGLNDVLGNIADRLFGHFGQNSQNDNQNKDSSTVTTTPSVDTTSPEVTENPSVENTATNSGSSSTASATNALRATTFAVAHDSSSTTDATTSDSGYTYFPLTLYNYDDRYNAAMHQQEVNTALASTAGLSGLTQWNGLYFGGNGFGAATTSTETFTYAGTGSVASTPTYSAVQSGTYYLDAELTVPVNVKTTESTNDTYVTASVTYNDLASSDGTFETNYWYLVDETYYQVSVTRSSGKETFWGMTYEVYTYRLTYLDTQGNEHEIRTYSGIDQFSVDESISGLNLYTPETTTLYELVNSSTNATICSSTNASDAVLVTLYTAATGGTTSALGYANYNKWTGNISAEDKTYHGNMTYSGLVVDELQNGSIQFTVPEAGIFNNDKTVKDIHTNVYVPFVLDSDGWYNFDANTYGVYYHEDAGQGSTAMPADGTSTTRSQLYINETTKQTHDFSAQDKRTTGWFPFNDATTICSTHKDTNHTCNNGEAADFFFGAQCSVEFFITSDGYLIEGDNTSKPIQFNFSGDDDVWVFIDNQLVLDMGGVHNGLNGQIDFSTATWSITPMVALDGKTMSDVNNKAVSGNLFGDDGVIEVTDLETFASQGRHTLTIFYLERGAGSSNCQIKFNLPMVDALSVTKLANEKVAVNESDESDGVLIYGLPAPLDAATQAIVDQIEFTFTLYKKTAADTALDVVPDAVYYIYNQNNVYVGQGQTTTTGEFKLKNGQTAKFITEVPQDGVTYQVVEHIRNGFVQTNYTYSGKYFGNADGSVNEAGNEISATSTHQYCQKTDSGHFVTNTDYNEGLLPTTAYTIYGNLEGEDYLNIVCENYLNGSLPMPSAIINSETVVLDYGLPVQIDITRGDYYVGDEWEWTIDADQTYKYGTVEFDTATNILTYTPTSLLNGVETIRYTLTVTAKDVNGEASTTDTGTVTIIPATTVYYEENFGNLVTYSDGWTEEKTVGTNTYQETGYVNDTTDSTYGSDVAYRDDSADSNGTSRYVSTAEAAANFSYTFTGTGTTFFARTSTTSGCMKIVIYDSTNTAIYQYIRDTKFTPVSGSTITQMYNIPVFTWDATAWGTYTVKVTIAGTAAAESVGYGPNFWLDGIRVTNPLHETALNATTAANSTVEEDYAVAAAAYALDGETNMTYVTLRTELLNSDWSGAIVFTDSNGEIKTKDEYNSIGPKEEVYLNAGQSVSFTFANWDPNVSNLYLGMKAPNGNGTATVGASTISVNNTTDCYYDITTLGTKSVDSTSGIVSYTFKITAGSNSLISVTNIKVTGTTAFLIGQDIYVDGHTGAAD